MKQRLILCFLILLSGYAYSQSIAVYHGEENLPEEIIKDCNAFKALSNHFVNLGLSNQSRYFLVTELYNSQFAISVENPLLDSVDFIALDYGHLTLLKSSNLGYSQTLINEMGVDSLLIRIKSKTPIIAPFSFKKIDQIKKDNNEIENFFFFFIGIMLSVLLYNVFIYLSTKDLIYLIYVFFVLILLLTQLCLFGQLELFLKDIMPYKSEWVLFFGSMSGLITIYFALEFLSIKKYSIWIYRISILSICSYLLVFLFLLLDFNDFSFNLINANASLSILLLIAAYNAMKKGYRPAIYFMVAFSTFLIGVTVFALKDYGVITYSSVTKYSLPIGVMIEAILLSLALADRINILKREKEASQAQAILMMEENQRLIHEQNAILEKEVEARTREITSTNHDLEKTLANLQLTQKQLVESEKLASLGQMTAGIAHEINNPVNFVRSNVQPLKRDVDELIEIISQINPSLPMDDLQSKWNALQQKYKELDVDYLQKEIYQLLQGIDEGSKRTADIVRSLRVFSRMDRDALVLADVNECITSTLMVMKNITSKEVTLSTHLDTALPQIHCYPGKLNQVLMNLIANAVHATKKDNRAIQDRLVDVSTTKENEFIKIVVKDNGTGMKEEVRKKIFDPFFTTKQVGEGTGLGLSIVLGIVQEHGGEIHIDSEWDKGTSFTILLPINANHSNL
jgi:signal transduction histidine kinase